MDQLDHNLLCAWDRVFQLCKADPVEARRRYERTLAGTTLDRPARAWCVAVRASDTRLNSVEGALGGVVGGQPGDQGDGRGQTLEEWINGVAPSPGPSLEGGEFYSPSPGAALQGGEWCEDAGGFDVVRARVAHEICIDAFTMSYLGGPVKIPYPGVPLTEAAELLGRHVSVLRQWMPVKPGRTSSARAGKGLGQTHDGGLAWAEFKPTAKHPLGVRYVPHNVADRGRGMEVPVVWYDGPIDPGADRGRPPSRWWGSLWMSLADRIADDFEQVVERVPIFKEIRGRRQFRGWQWRCPGLFNAHEPRVSASGHESEPAASRSRLVEPSASQGCGRLVKALYAPLPVWTIGKYWGIEEGLEVEGLSGQWLPGVMDRWAGRRSLACERCWRIRNEGFSGRAGWNALVTHLSGGLLFGSEVEKPAEFAYVRRRQQTRPWKARKRAVRRRDTVAAKQVGLAAAAEDQQAAQA